MATSPNEIKSAHQYLADKFEVFIDAEFNSDRIIEFWNSDSIILEIKKLPLEYGEFLSGSTTGISNLVILESLLKTKYVDAGWKELFIQMKYSITHEDKIKQLEKSTLCIGGTNPELMIKLQEEIIKIQGRKALERAKGAINPFVAPVESEPEETSMCTLFIQLQRFSNEK